MQFGVRKIAKANNRFVNSQLFRHCCLSQFFLTIPNISRLCNLVREEAQLLPNQSEISNRYQKEIEVVVIMKHLSQLRKTYKQYNFLFLPFMCISLMEFFHRPILITQKLLTHQQKQLGRINIKCTCQTSLHELRALAIY